MPDTIRERIIALVKSKLEAGLTDVAIFRAGEAAINVDEGRALIIQDLGDSMKRHLRIVYENTLRLSLQVLLREGDDAKRLASLNALLADIQKVVATNEKWNDGSVDLAKRTWMRSTTPTLSEILDPSGVDLLALEILYRVKRTDPYALSEI